jgi:outer membrane receptor protein involved in Fe transport
VTSLDVALRYRKDTNFGDFGFRSEYTHTLDHKYQQSPGDEVLNVRDDPFWPALDFRSIWSGTLAYEYKDFSTALTFIRRGSTTAWPYSNNPTRFLERVENDDYRVSPYITYNLTAGYQITDSIDTRIRVQNLFDEGPPRDDSFGNNNEYPWYNYFSYPGAGLGRQASLELNLRFD